MAEGAASRSTFKNSMKHEYAWSLRENLQPLIITDVLYVIFTITSSSNKSAVTTEWLYYITESF